MNGLGMSFSTRHELYACCAYVTSVNVNLDGKENKMKQAKKTYTITGRDTCEMCHHHYKDQFCKYKL